MTDLGQIIWALMKIKQNNICETFSRVSTTNQILHKILSSLEYCLILPTLNNWSLLGSSISCSVLLIKHVNAFFCHNRLTCLKEAKAFYSLISFHNNWADNLENSTQCNAVVWFQKIWHYLSRQVWNRGYSQQKESTYWLIKRLSRTHPLKKKKSPSLLSVNQQTEF